MLQTALAVVLVATDTAAPSPQASIPTIIEVHSSPYCTAVHKMVAPALVGFMRNDARIKVGLSAMLRMDHDFKYGGLDVTSWCATGGPTHTQLPGNVKLFDDRMQQTASASSGTSASSTRSLQKPITRRSRQMPTGRLLWRRSKRSWPRSPIGRKPRSIS